MRPARTSSTRRSHCGWFCTMKPSPIFTPVRSRTAMSSSASLTLRPMGFSPSRELVSVCSLASSHAVSVNQAHRLRLDQKTGHYSIEKRASDRGAEGRSVSAREVPGGEGELDTRITIEIYKSGDDATDADRKSVVYGKRVNL